MKELFIAFFFGRILLLTPDGIDIGDGWTELLPEKALVAITSGANIQIDISSMITRGESEELTSFRKRIYEAFPKSSIKAELEVSERNKVLLDIEGVSVGRNTARLILQSKDGVPVDVKFKKVMLYSDVRLENIKIFWMNYSK